MTSNNPRIPPQPSTTYNFNPSTYSPTSLNPSSFNPFPPGLPSSFQPSPFRSPLPPAYNGSLAGRASTTPSLPPSLASHPLSFQPSIPLSPPPLSSYLPSSGSPSPLPPALRSPPSFAPHSLPGRTPNFNPSSRPPTLPPTWTTAPSLNQYFPAPNPPISGFTGSSPALFQPLPPASLHHSNSFAPISPPPSSFNVASPPSSLSGRAHWAGPFSGYQKPLSSRNPWSTPWASPPIESSPFPSDKALMRVSSHCSFPTQQQTIFPAFEASSSNSLQREFEKTIRALYKMDAPPERPFSTWSTMNTAQFALQIGPQTTLFINPAVVTDFFQRATSDQKWAAQAQLNQLIPFNRDERRLSSIERVKNLVLNAWDNPRVQGSLQVLGGVAEISAGYGMTFASGLIAAPIGHIAIVHGIDHFTTGLFGVITGKNKSTATQTVLVTAGVPPETAGSLDAGLSIVGVGMGAKVASQLVTYPQLKLPPLYLNESYNRVALETHGAMKPAFATVGTMMAKEADVAVEASARVPQVVPANGKELISFTDVTARRLCKEARRIPIQILDNIIKFPTAVVKDPKGASNAIMYYSQIWKNKKLYNAEVLYDTSSNTIMHFHYSRDSMGPLKKIPKPQKE